MKLSPIPALLSVATVLCIGSVAAQTQAVPFAPGTPAPKPAVKAPVFVGPYRVINWEELVPAGWDPMKEFKGVDLNAMNDSDPRAMQLMKRVREVWDNAPANAALEGQAIRIPGFVVPLEEAKDGLKEFLLVPYFGACVHTPPPPANQIIHVLPKAAAKGLRSMDAVWISGNLVRTRTESYMGTSSWRMEAKSVEPYSDKPSDKPSEK
jgi:uncharacterized protein